MTLPSTDTLAAALAAAIDRAARYDASTQAAPTCVLWTDERIEWKSVVDRLRPRWPRLLTLGDYAPEARTGPSVWLRYIIEGPPQRDSPDDLAAAGAPALDVLYLPGVSAASLRNAAALPALLALFAPLQYTGVVWSPKPARDWTPHAFLSTASGLGLDVARDAATFAALARALPALLDTPLGTLRDRRLEAPDFDALLAPDPVRALLRWLDAPGEARRTMTDEEWAAFTAVLRTAYGVDADRDGPVGAALRLGRREGPWGAVWNRFSDAPARFPGVAGQLRAARPQAPDLFAPPEEVWPQDNEEEEAVLRTALRTIPSLSPLAAATLVGQLDERHGHRRTWVWAELGQAPLACALGPLTDLARAAARPLTGPTPEACAEAYAGGGFEADDAFVRALAASVPYEDELLVAHAATALYRPWLERTAETFAASLGGGLPPQPDPTGADPEPGVALLFVDALRYDVGGRLAGALRASGLSVDVRPRWVAFPPLTPTSKPALSPVADRLDRASVATDFCPRIEGGPDLTIARFRSLLEGRGFQVLMGGDTGNPEGAAWTEIGTLDRYGHEQGWKLARRLSELVSEAAGRVRALLGAGWREVRIVTDHGWLLLPGGLPKSELPSVFAETRWGRCAVLKAGSAPALPTYGWYWNDDVRVAVARGIHAFRAGLDYAHGGLTLQECVVPELRVRAGTAGAQAGRITGVSWRGFLCRVQAEGPPGATVDVRRHAADPASSAAASPKALQDGRASLLVPDDTLEGTDAYVVLSTATGQILHQVRTTIAAP